VEVGQFEFHTKNGMVTAESDGVTYKIWPLLSFRSRSPDHCWTIFANRYQRRGPWMEFKQLVRHEDTWTAEYQSDISYDLRLEPVGRSLSLKSTAMLVAPIYSQLNTYCQANLVTAKRVELRFSPCRDYLIEVKPWDYPVGRPARMAHFTGEEFRIVEASSGEKGPFEILASGQLSRGEPVSIDFILDGQQSLSLELEDWSREASVDLSPTAGWGLPMNAIEFSRSGNCYTVWITLAATSVGRGWDSVGHAPGCYRGGMKVLVK